MSLLGREYLSLPVVVPDDARDLAETSPPQTLSTPAVATRPSEQRPGSSVHGEPGVAD